MPQDDTGPDSRDAGLRDAVRRLLAFRDTVLKFPAEMIQREGRLPRGIVKNTSDPMIRLLLDDPAWHAVEEALK